MNGESKRKFKKGDGAWVIAHQPLRLPMKVVIRSSVDETDSLIHYMYYGHPNIFYRAAEPHNVFKTKDEANAALKLQWTRDYKELKEREQI